MHQPLRRAFLGLLLATVAASSAFAGSLKSQWVAADAQWMTHVDVDAMLKARLVKHVLDNPERFDIEMDGIDEFKQHTGLDPLKDIRDLTAYGTGDPEEGNFVIIVTVASTIDQVLEKMKTEAPGYREITADGRTIHSFKDDEHPTLFFSIRNEGAATGGDRVVVMSHDLDKLVTGLEVIEGKGPALGANKPAADRPSPGAGSIVFIAANGLPWIEDQDEDEHNPASALLRSSEQITIDIGESGTETFISGSLAVGSTEDAASVVEVLKGFAALGRIASKQEPEFASFSDLLNGIALNSNGNRVQISIRQPTDRLIHALEQAAALDDDSDDDADEDDGDDDDEEVKVKTKTSQSIKIHEH